MQFKYYLTLALVAGVIASCNEDNVLTPEKSSTQAGASYEYVPNEVLVKFKAGAGSGARASSILSAVDAEILETLVTGDGKSAAGGRTGESGSLVLAISKFSTMEAIARLKQLPEVEYAEPNFIYRHFEGSNDPYYTSGSLWGMYGDATTPSNAYGSQAGEAWSTNAGAEVWIGIIDEGYMHSHEDLSANAGKNPGETEGNGVDDDGNGYIDDVYGWDFDGNNNTVFDGVGDDHGTHVAGTIGASGNNGKGVAGVSWDVNLMNAKFLGKRGGTTANAIKAVDYFTNLKINAGINLVATNNSWGGGGFSQGLADAISRAGAANILFIAAAGNDARNNDSSPSYPASYQNANIVSVASIDSRGALSSFSNWGQNSVDLAAPGSAIYSTVPKRSGGNVIAGYAGYSGTSMATPHVTGAVALYAAFHSGATAEGIKSALLRSTTPTSSLNNKCASNGRLNVSELLITQPL
ncbi:MAG TPA: S8 family peptidase [Chryseosolibacter sp.]|nr:S8 family peptidase [Chryseosolibacter sp.]